MDEHRLRHRMHAKPGHAGDLVRPHEAAMLDPVAPVGIGGVVERQPIGVENLVDGAIADGVDRELVAPGMIIAHERAQLLRREAEQALVCGLAEIGGAHRRGACAGAAVGEDLHRPDREAVVAGAGDEALGIGPVDDAAGPAEEALVDAYRQTAGRPRRPVGGDLPKSGLAADRGVHDARDAEGEAMPPRALDRGNEIGIRDGRQHRPDPVAGALGEEAGEPPVALLDDAAGGRRGRTRRPGRSGARRN